MFGRFGWAEILVVVVLVLILFGHNKIPGMMKNLADGINVFKKELNVKKSKKAEKEEASTGIERKASAKKNAPNKTTKVRRTSDKKGKK